MLLFIPVVGVIDESRVLVVTVAGKLDIEDKLVDDTRKDIIIVCICCKFIPVVGVIDESRVLVVTVAGKLDIEGKLVDTRKDIIIVCMLLIYTCRWCNR